MKRFVFSLATTVCLLVVVCHYSPVAAKDKWVSVQTKNFFLVGNTSEKEIRQVAVRLEQFREAFSILLPGVRINTPVPTTVVVFKSQDSYAPFRPQPNISGYFQPGPDVNYITLTTETHGYVPNAIKLSGSQDPFTIIFHEYTHLLVNNMFENAPLWFNEGLAEYYSTFKITDDQKFAVGTPIGSHVYQLRESKILPLKTLFAVDHKSPHYNESKKQGIFYAESWALMHYLLIGKTGMVEHFTKFLDLTTANVAVEEAFQKAFGMSYEAMEKELRNYVQQDRYNVLSGHFKEKLDIDTTAQATPLTEAEAQAYLGDLLLHSHRLDALDYLQKAVTLDPNLAMAHASLGMAYFQQGKLDQARQSLERAVTLSSQNYLVHYYYAFALSRQGPDDAPVSDYPSEVAAKIREHLQKAIALRPDYPESYRLLAFVSLVTGDNLEAAIASMKKLLSASPGRHDFSFLLAQLYLRTGDYKQACQVLEQIGRSNADDSLKQSADTLLKQVQALEEQSARYQEAKKAADAGALEEPVLVRAPEPMLHGGSKSTSSDAAPTANPAPTPAADQSAYLREVLRAPGAGETQLQATLLRIECDAKGIVFVVQTGTGLLRLRTPSFDDVEITTYDSSVKGEITCGERKPANGVIVDYVPNTDKRIKADGIIKSIEFVPADFKLKT